MEFTSQGFLETQWKQEQKFETIDNLEGSIEVFYLREFPAADEGPFLKEERNLITNISSLIEGHLNSIKGKEGRYITRERLKELSAINQTTRILRAGKPVEEALHEICLMLPKAWQYPEFTACRIRYGNYELKTPNFLETQWCQKQVFETIDNQEGSIEIYYLKGFPASYEGPFLAEERHLIINVANLIAGYLNSVKGKAILRKNIAATNQEDVKPDRHGERKIQPATAADLPQPHQRQPRCLP